MKREEKIALGIAGAAALLGGAWWYSEATGESVFDMATDWLALLTTSEAERMNQLQPETQSKLHDLILALGTDGMRVHVGQTLRTKAQEKANFDAGKTSANLTHSWHQLGRAVDLYPYDPATGQPDMEGKNLALFIAMHAKAREMGFHGIAFEADGVTRHYLHNSLGNPVWDGGHLEDHGSYATVAQAWAAEGPSTA